MDSKYSIVITAYEYGVLSKNHLISLVFDPYLRNATQYDGDEVELTLTLKELQYLIGYVAAESNHARSKRNSDDLNSICDFLEAVEEDIKHDRVESLDI